MHFRCTISCIIDLPVFGRWYLLLFDMNQWILLVILHYIVVHFHRFALNPMQWVVFPASIKRNKYTRRILTMGFESNNHTVGQWRNVLLTHWGRDKMAAIFKTTFCNGFSWMEMYEFGVKFHWSLFLGVHLTTCQHWFRSWLGDKPLSEPMMVRLLTHICVNRPQWVNMFSLFTLLCSITIRLPFDDS